VLAERHVVEVCGKVTECGSMRLENNETLVLHAKAVKLYNPIHVINLNCGPDSTSLVVFCCIASGVSFQSKL
jgi:hypothetical protein